MTLLPTTPLHPVHESDNDDASNASTSTGAAATPSRPTPQPQQQQQYPSHHHHHGGGEEEDWVLTAASTDAEHEGGAELRPSWSHHYLHNSAPASTKSSPDRHSSMYGGGGDSPGSMGRRRVSFTRMDNIPHVRIDLKHLSYYVKNTKAAPASSFTSTNDWLPAGLRRRWPFAAPSTSFPRPDGVQPKPPPLAAAPEPDTMTPILQDISLSFTPGTLTGLMGPSGSGKTSLLHVLHGAAKHTRGGVLEGTVLVNGTPCRNIHHAFRKMCSLVPQEDVLLPELTVQETLRFAAELRLPQTDTKEERAETVNAVLLELGLDECKDVRIGCVEQAGGISGGQKRRVSIGLELLTDPSVLLLDEPTSGLDSKTAEDICNLLQSLAGPDRCVVCSIHQPSYQIFMSCFDRFVFLVTGRIAFDGPPSRLASFFYGLGYEAPSYENPADFYIKCLQEVPEAVLEAWRTVAAKRDKEDLEAAIAGTSGFSVLPSSSSSSTSLPPLPRPSSRGGMGKVFGSNHSMSRGGGGTGELPSMVDGSTAGGHPSLVLPGGEVLVLDREATWLDKEAAADVLQQNSFLHQFSVLLRRMMTHNCKDRRKVLVGLGMEIFTGLVVGVVWFQQEVYTQKSVFPVLGVFCMLTTISIFDSFLNLILTFPLTRALHFREYNNGYYHLLPYFLASMASACIMSALYQLTDVAIVFFMVGLPFTIKRFFLYMGVCAIGSCIGASLGFLVGCFTSDIHRMQQIVVPTLLPLLIFSGYMIPLARMPTYLTWIYYGSFYQYIYSSLVISHFTGLVFRDCPASPPDAPARCMHRGEEILKSVALAPDQLTRNVGILVGTLALFLILGYSALRYKSR